MAYLDWAIVVGLMFLVFGFQSRHPADPLGQVLYLPRPG